MWSSLTIPGRPEIIAALVETTSLWGIALGVLGLSVVRGTPDKNASGAGRLSPIISSTPKL